MEFDMEYMDKDSIIKTSLAVWTSFTRSSKLRFGAKIGEYAIEKYRIMLRNNHLDNISTKTLKLFLIVNLIKKNHGSFTSFLLSLNDIVYSDVEEFTKDLKLSKDTYQKELSTLKKEHGIITIDLLFNLYINKNIGMFTFYKKANTFDTKDLEQYLKLNKYKKMVYKKNQFVIKLLKTI